MVDYYGQWTYEPDTPEEKKCDCDRIADWIKEKDYKPKTTIENLVQMIITHFDSPDHYGKYDTETGCGGYGKEFTVEECKRYVEESGGFKEFDYFCQSYR